MEKRLLLAVGLSVGVLILWTSLFTPRTPVPGTGARQEPGGAPAAAAPGAGAAGTNAGSAPAGGTVTEAGSATGSVTGPGQESVPEQVGVGGAAVGAARPDLPDGRPVAATAEEQTTIDTPLVAIRLTNRGGRVTSWVLKKYLDHDGKPLDLVSPAGHKLDHLPLQFLLDDPEATRRLKEALYRVERRDATEEGHAIVEVSYAYSDGTGLQATKSLRIDPSSYVVELRVAAAVGGKAVTPTLVWGAGFGAHNGLETGRFSDVARAVVDLGERVPRLVPQEKVKPQAPVVEGGPIAWAGLEDRYFAALLVPQTALQGGAPAGQARIELLRLVEDGRELFFMSFALGVPGASHYHLFVGPKDYDLLKGFHLGLERLLDFGFFGVVAKPLFYALKFIQRYVGNFGWSIVLLTVLIRLIFFPIMHRGQVKMRKMQEKMKRVQPRVKAMRERYHRLERKEAEKGSASRRHQLRQQMNQEMMDLYKEEGINPLGSMSGCLPLLLQLPILYAFYAILTIAIELRSAPFMFWIRDLSQKDPYFVTPIVMGLTMLVQQVMTSSTIADPAQRRMMMIMPIMFTFFFINLPSGLVLYWLTSNLLGILQQYLINKEVEAEKQAA